MSHYPDTGLLSLLDEEMRNIMFPYGNFVETTPNQVIITKGGSPHFYIVISGNYQVSIQGPKAKVTLENVIAGDCFGEMCLFNNAGATATVVGLDSGKLWYTNSAQFQRFLYDSDVAGCALLVGINTVLSRRLKLANQLIRQSRIKPSFVSVGHRPRQLTSLIGSLTSFAHPVDPAHHSAKDCQLKPTGILAYLTEESLQILSSYGEYKSYGEDAVVIRENTNLSRFYILLEGRLEIFSEVDRAPAHLGFAEPGECIGEVSLLDPGPASASVEVLQHSVLWSMGRDALRKLICDDPGLSGALLFGMAHGLEERLRHADELIALHQDEDVAQEPLRTPQTITDQHPAQVSSNLFKILKVAERVGSRLLQIRHREGSVKVEKPVQLAAPEDQLALFKAQDLVQLFCLNGRKIKLEVVSDSGEKGEIFIWDGKVNHSVCGVQVGNEAFYTLILLNNTKLKIQEISEEPPSTVTAGWESLLMEAAVRKDTQAVQ